MDALAQAVLSGNRLALARLLTQVENDTAQGRQALSDLFPHTGRAHLVGVTGAPGTGKSSLVNALARHYRQAAEPARVGILAVDPSSPFTGGAILGDRVRMRDLAGDPGVFIRSMASRGSLGGLAAASAAMAHVLDAAGFELVLVETVGAGQAEVDIARLADTTIVIEAPGLGDDIQAIKAGILEIADLLVINKADRPGVDATERALKGMLQLAHPLPRLYMHHGRALSAPEPAPEAPAGAPMWIPPVLRTVATEGAGIAELAAEIDRHRQHLELSGLRQQRDQARMQDTLESLVRDALHRRWQRRLPDGLYSQVLAEMSARRLSPWQALEQLVGGGEA